MSYRLAGSLLSGLLLALSFPLTLLPLPVALQAMLPFDLPADPALGSLAIPGLPTAAGYIQFPALAFIALVPLLLAIRSARSATEAFRLGLACGFVWLTLTFLWIVNFGWAPVLLMAAFYGLAVALFAYLSWQLMHAPARPWLETVRTLWGIPSLWTAIEYLRSFGFWGFPWHMLGVTQASDPLLLQTADLAGVYGITFIIVLANAAVVLLLSRVGTAGLRLRHACAAGLLLLATLGYGWWRMAYSFPEEKAPPDAKSSLSFALVQGGQSSLERWSDKTYEKSLKAYMDPTRRLFGGPSLSSAMLRPQGKFAPASSPRENPACASLRQASPALATGSGDLLVVWPESCIAKPGGMDPRRGDTIPYEIRSVPRGRSGTALLLGAMGMPRKHMVVENGCILVQDKGNPTWPYSKVRLVPYGEVTPLRGIVTFLRFPWDFGGGDLTAGTSLAPIAWRGHRIGALICFDNVFSFLTRKEALAGAQYFVLMTNNSWYPLRSGVRQHCDLDVLRTVECRRPLARVSTTGWSQVVDRGGRIVESTHSRVGVPEVLQARIGPGSGVTPYMLVGDVFAQVCVALSLLLCLPVLVVGRSEGFL